MNRTRAFRSSSVRSVVGACAAAWLAALPMTGGCSPDGSAALWEAGTVSLGGASASSGAGNVAGRTFAGGTNTSGSSGTAGGASNVGTAGSGVAASGSSSGGAMTGGGGRGGGSSGGGSSSGGTGGSAAKPCVDTMPPPNAEWPDATCQSWANETKECSAAWFATYCDVSCKRCVPAGGGSAGSGAGTGGAGSGGSPGTPAVDCSTKGMPNVSGGNGYATRYWDCCQPHCAQFDGHRCEQNGTTQTGNNQSACSGGGSYACYDESPKAVNDCLSYGYIAKSNPNCGQCYRIQFTGEGQHNVNDPGSKLIKGKQMIVKVSNTGGDVANNQFDLMIPGGGVGQFNACSKQWGSSDLGAQYGGFLTNCTGSYEAKKTCVRQQCMKVPAGSARDGCLWFVDWLQAADNPKFTSQQTDCPF